MVNAVHGTLIVHFGHTYTTLSMRRSLQATGMLVIGAIQNFVGLERILTAFWGETGMTPAEYLNLTDIASNYIESVTWILQVALGDSFLVRDLSLQYSRTL